MRKKYKLKEDSVRFTIIDHTSRIKLGLTGNSGILCYILADSIYHLCNNPHNKNYPYTKASPTYLAKWCGVHRTSIYRYIRRLQDKGIITSCDKGIKVTDKWYNTVIASRNTRNNIRKELNSV